jgi:Tol biopolymer transport system component
MALPKSEGVRRGRATRGFLNQVPWTRRAGVVLALMIMAGFVATGPVDATYAGTTNGRLAMGIDFGGNTDVYSVNPNGRGLRRLTDNPGFDACPAYSPDGKHITYCGGDNSSSAGVIEIWVMKSNGRKHRQVTHIGGRMTFPDFSPEGNRIVFSGVVPGATTADVYAIDGGGANLVRLTTDAAHDQFPAWSPDGTKITFVSSRTGTPQVWVMDADGSNQKQLTFDAPIKGQLPDWSPDGMKIAYATFDAVLGSDLWVMDANGSNQVQLTSDPDQQIGAAWSPDGTKIAFLNGLPNRYVNVVNADGSGRYVVFSAGLQFVPGWQPRGDRF